MILLSALPLTFEEYMKEHCASYPDVKFAIIDTTVEGDNIVSISFCTESGFLFWQVRQQPCLPRKTDIEGVNPEKIIGWVGGMDIPVLHDFFTGYEQGAKIH